MFIPRGRYGENRFLECKIDVGQAQTQSINVLPIKAEKHWSESYQSNVSWLNSKKMKGIVIYHGKYGATRQYAEWIGKKQNLPVITSDEINGDQLANYNFLILGSSVYFGKLLLAKWFKKNQSFLYNKKIFLFSVSGTPPDQTQVLQSYIENSVSAEIRNNMEVYFFPGRLNKKSLSWFHYYMLRVGAWLEKDPVAKKRMTTDYDAVQIENTYQLESSLNRFCGIAV